MIAGYLSLYLIVVIVASLIVGLLAARLKLPSPRLVVTLFIILVVSPLVAGYFYLVYFGSLPEVIVPTVTGVSLDVARERLEAVNLRVREAGQVYEPKYPEGIIIYQRPEAGRNVKIGRIVSLMVNSSESKVPWLGDIPWLGNLFKSKSKTDGKTELLIFLTPHIVESPSQLAMLSSRETRQSGLITNSISERELDQFLDRVPLKKAQ